MKKILFMLFTTPLLLYSSQTTIESKEASLEENRLFLDGKVKIQHPFGILSSDSAIVEKSIQDKLKKADFNKHVSFLLSNDSSLTCEKATIDFEDLIGSLSSSKSKVIYRDVIAGKNEDSAIDLSCKNVRFKLKKMENENYEVQRLDASTEVVVNLPHDLVIFADRAYFQRLIDPLKQDNIPPGIIHFYPKKKGKCVLEKSLNRIECDTMTLNTKYQEIQMKHAKGALSEAEQEKSLQFETDLFVWNQTTNQLLFLENNYVEDESLGIIESSDRIEMDWNAIFGKLQVNEIRSKGYTKINLTNLKEEGQSFICHGNSVLNKILQTYHAKKPSKPHQSLDLASQNQYSTKHMTIFSDDMKMDYRLENTKIFPTLIECSGHVRILSENQKVPFDSAFCDTITYYPEEQLIVLNGSENNKVLFSNNLKQMEMCADTIVIENKDTVKGIGRVQFSFDKTQRSQFKQFFKSPPH